MTDDSFIEEFADETREHLEELERCLLQLASTPKDSELLNTIFRAVHTIKGASEYLGFERIGGLSHRLESLLDAFRNGTLVADKVAVDILIDGRDRIGELISRIEESGQDNLEIEDLMSRIEAFSSGSQQEDDQEKTPDGGEADTELVGIFLDQLTSGLEQLLKTAGRIARGEDVAKAAEELADQVDRLAATANYMGYDGLAEVYDDLQEAIGSFSFDLENVTDEMIDAFIHNTIIDGLVRIQSLFPQSSVDDIDPLPILEKPTDDLAPDEEDGDLLLLDEADGEDDAGDEDNLKSDLFLDMEDDLVFGTDESEPPSESVSGQEHSLVDDFVDEAHEHLDELERCLLRLSTEPDDKELLNTVFRSLHTIKGASEYMGFEGVACLSHRLETLLDRFREGSLHMDKTAVDVLIDSRDRIKDMISEIESSGQESSRIEDILARITAVSSGEAASEDADGASSTYEGEADTELFGIFLDQLSAGLEQVVETAGRIARRENIDETAKAMREQVQHLAATANYMGYDELSKVYGDWQSAINAFSSQLADIDDEAIDAFLQTSIVAGMGSIQSLFPQSQKLAAIDTSGLACPVDKTVEPEGENQTRLQPTSDIDPLLAKLPAIDDAGRADLLANSLDKNFESLTSGDEVDRDKPDGLKEDDPFSIRFVTEDETDDAEAAPAHVESEDDAENMSIFDDYSSDQEILPPEIEEAPEADDPMASTVDTDQELEFWPEVDAPALPAAEMEVAEPEPAIPAIDYTTPPADEQAVEASKKEDPAKEKAKPASTVRRSIRIDAEKVDGLMNQVGELVVNRSTFAQLVFEMRELSRSFYQRFPMDKEEQRLLSGVANRLNDATAMLGRVTGDLQEQVMKVRMLPISQLFNRYPRVVHDLLKNSDKKVQLQLRGEDTELDRMVIEKLADPMLHIVRNAVDHGIENTEGRKSKGKQESGVLVLEAYYEGNNVVIEVADDGKGIDLSKIRQKAVEKNLADGETLNRMNQQELIDLIMLPGFSTADQVTHTSGRGVGMDVVKRSIEKINGSLSIETRQDVGTRFTIKIPLTLAIIPAMMVDCENRHFTVPMSNVEETLRIDPGEIFTVDGSEVMHLYEDPLPLIRLAELLDMQAALPRATGHGGQLFVLVVKSASGRAGFIVDALHGRQEVVIKPMDDYLQEDSGFSGATILGDGSISLILNVEELVRMARQREAERKLASKVL